MIENRLKTFVIAWGVIAAIITLFVSIVLLFMWVASISANAAVALGIISAISLLAFIVAFGDKE